MQNLQSIEHVLSQLNLHKAFNYSWTLYEFPISGIYHLIILHKQDTTLHDTIQCESSNFVKNILTHLYKKKYISDEVYSLCEECYYDVLPINSNEIIFIRHNLPSMAFSVKKDVNINENIKKCLEFTEKRKTLDTVSS